MVGAYILPPQLRKRAIARKRPTAIGALVAVVVAIMMLYGFSVVLAAKPPAAIDSNLQPSASTAITILPLSSATPIPGTFWGINIEPGSAFSVTDAKLLATTPVTYLRYPGGSHVDQLNYTSGVITNKTGVVTQAVTTPSVFVASCEAIHCHAIMGLPAEIDSPATAAYYVKYVEKTLGFTPAYWAVGNEPSVWHHFDQPWSTWAKAPIKTETIAQYTAVLRSYAAAIHSVDPTTPLIAPSIGAGTNLDNTCSTWCGPVAAADGSLLAAISVHSYVAYPPPASTSLGTFFSLLRTSPYALPTVVPRDRAIIAHNYSGPLALALDEISTVPSATYGEETFATYTGELYGGLFDAAQTTQLLALNVADVDWFDWSSSFYSWAGATSGSLSPTGQVFQTFMSQLYNEYDPTTVVGPSTVYAAATTDGTNLALLVVNVNVNTTGSYSFPLSTLFSGTVNETSWAVGSSITSAKVANTTAKTLPLSVSVWRGHGHASGPPPPTLKSVAVTPSPASVLTGGVQSFLATPSCTSGPCPSGVTYSWSLTNPLGVLNSSSGSKVRFTAGATPGTDTVFVNATLNGVTQQSAPDRITIVSSAPSTYPVTFGESGLPTGTLWSVTLNGTNESSTTSPIKFKEPNGTYAFTVGSVTGYTASPSSGSVTVHGGPVSQAIVFGATVPGQYAVTFVESGLVSGTSWSITLAGTTQSSATDTIAFTESNGTYPYSASAPGYSTNSSSLIVNGHDVPPTSVVFTTTSSPLPGLPILDFAIIGVAVVVAAIELAVILRRRGGGGRSGPKMPTAEQGPGRPAHPPPPV